MSSDEIQKLAKLSEKGNHSFLLINYVSIIILYIHNVCVCVGECVSQRHRRPPPRKNFGHMSVDGGGGSRGAGQSFVCAICPSPSARKFWIVSEETCPKRVHNVSKMCLNRLKKVLLWKEVACSAITMIYRSCDWKICLKVLFQNFVRQTRGGRGAPDKVGQDAWGMRGGGQNSSLFAEKFGNGP